MNRRIAVIERLAQHLPGQDRLQRRRRLQDEDAGLGARRIAGWLTELLRNIGGVVADHEVEPVVASRPRRQLQREDERCQRPIQCRRNALIILQHRAGAKHDRHVLDPDQQRVPADLEPAGRSPILVPVIPFRRLAGHRRRLHNRLELDPVGQRQRRSQQRLGVPTIVLHHVNTDQRPARLRQE